MLNAFGTGAQAGFWTSYDLDPRQLGDVNGDGKADIVGFGQAGVYVSLNDGTGRFAPPQLVLNAFGTGAQAGFWTSYDLDPRQLGDVNGDGKADIVGLGKSGVYVSLNDGTGRFAPPQLVLNAFGTGAQAGSGRARS